MSKLRVGVVKLSSCSGCINEFLYAIVNNPPLLSKISIELFTEMSSEMKHIDALDVVLIEGSVTTEEHEKLVEELRNSSRIVVALGTCATSGGVQGFLDSLELAKEKVYPVPSYVETLERSKPLREVVKVDLELPGCPINGEALASYLKKLVMGGSEIEILESLCAECKRLGVPCLVITKRIPCLGPVVRAGCGAICPRNGRGCYGCFGIKGFDVDEAKLRKLIERYRVMGVDIDALMDLASRFNPLIKSFVGGSDECI